VAESAGRCFAPFKSVRFCHDVTFYSVTVLWQQYDDIALLGEQIQEQRLQNRFQLRIPTQLSLTGVIALEFRRRALLPPNAFGIALAMPQVAVVLFVPLARVEQKCHLEEMSGQIILRDSEWQLQTVSAIVGDKCVAIA